MTITTWKLVSTDNDTNTAEVTGVFNDLPYTATVTYDRIDDTIEVFVDNHESFNPEPDFTDYEDLFGYKAFYKALTTSTPAE